MFEPCQWPGDPPRDLNSDAQRAEDLAIRYADQHDGVRSGMAAFSIGDRP